MKAWEVIAPGALTTVQDRGREGWRHLGVSRAGALDPDAMELANRLLGNALDAAVLELTLQGPTLKLTQAARIAIVGAEVTATSNGRALPGQRPLTVPAGELKLGGLRGGIRAWLSVAGGFDLPMALGSRSTDLRGGFGGIEGRALRAGDLLPLGKSPRVETAVPQRAAWWIGADDHNSGIDLPLRFVSAEHPASTTLADRTWLVSPSSNRQGIRLQGQPLPNAPHHNVSEPVAVGCIQLPPDGQPIILLADAQTVGGYARLGYVIAADLPRLAQAGPGAALAFTAIGIGEARRINLQHRHRQARTALAIDQRLARDP
ncbi:biotin-dependent carboxyltransferase family protein [Pseudoxanthomonas sacheonensis]|uniref:Antagonist of KipI n=1 Tax=Pseudoxanthomonas sacheonensis TaxID=443615 RepID=A0ABU1RPW7_9GAMM|nr:biotin-dependent carboxyltransferase family protein [Pseudoxanthomonas sacheonensis]MDR6840375.1 antagonist of KipI [Pseudoxanthomonas sacheonensis]